MTVSAGALLTAILATAGVALVLTTPLAMAEISGPCSASINGQSVNSVSSTSAGDAIPVKEHRGASVSMSSSRQITRLQVAISFGGFSWTVHDESSTGTSWSRNVSVDRYAKYGVGLYQVSGTSTGAGLSCTGTALVKVEGSPLSARAGQVGLAMAVVGGGGIAAAGAAAGAAAMRTRRSVGEWATDELLSDPPAKPVDTEGDGDLLEEQLGGPFGPLFFFCALAAIPALFMTLAAMMSSGAEQPAATPPPARAPRRTPPPRPRRIRISFVSLAGGLLAGLGAGVLLQQYSVIYPTRTIAIIELAAGLAVGLILPSLILAMTLPRRR